MSSAKIEKAMSSASQNGDGKSSSSTTSTTASQLCTVFFAIFFIPCLLSYIIFNLGQLREIVDAYTTSDGSSSSLPSSPSSDGQRRAAEQFPEDTTAGRGAAAALGAAIYTTPIVSGHTIASNLSPHCERRFRSIMGLLGQEETFKKANIDIYLHHNGDPNSCAKSTGALFLDELKNQYARFDGGCRPSLNKYEVESLLTSALHSLTEKSSCASRESDGEEAEGFLGFCDMGESKTPILPDHDDLLPIFVASSDESTSKRQRYLPCRFHTREGLRVSYLKQLTEMALFHGIDYGDDESVSSADDEEENQEQLSGTASDTQTGREIHLYAVPAGRVFMFAPSYIGEIFNLTHVKGAHDEPIYLEVLSLQPRVLDIYNFFSLEESQELVEKAIAEKSQSHKIKRSTTGAGSSSVNSRRTSESGWDTHGRTASVVKRRCFKALGFDEYWDTFGDGLQILRYNVSTSYNSHLDYIEDRSGQLEHDFDSSGTGGNRFATILLYMSDLGPDDGGETVFPKVWPPTLPVEERISTQAAIDQLRDSDRGNILERGSWEEQLVVKCRTRFSIRPHSSRAVLFYSQFPNGQVDPLSLHAACPLLGKQKYAANLWVWNTPRQGYPGAPIKEKFQTDPSRTNGQPNARSPVPPPKLKQDKLKQINAVFTNTGEDRQMDHAELYFQDKFWAAIGKEGSPVSVNTYSGHVWNIRANGKVVKSFKITEKDGPKQFHSI